MVDHPPSPTTRGPGLAAGTIAIAIVLAAAGACDSVDDRPASWAYLHPAVIAPACATAGCHSQLAALAGLDLSSRTGAYTVLTGRICGAPPLTIDPPGNYVFAGSPERSKLLYLLRGEDVRSMPPGDRLPDVEIDLVERWILEGAPCE